MLPSRGLLDCQSLVCCIPFLFCTPVSECSCREHKFSPVSRRSFSPPTPASSLLRSPSHTEKKNSPPCEFLVLPATRQLFLDAVIHHARISASQQAVLGRMQLFPSSDSRNTSRRFRAWCERCLPGRRKPDVFRLGVVGMRGCMVIRLRPYMS